MLEIKDLHVGYKRGIDIVKGVSLAVAPGEPTILLGPNGSGKSTLIKALVGVIKPRLGEIVFDGEVVDSPAKRSRLISYVPQNLALPPLSVYETILMGRLPLFGYKASKEDEEATIEIIKKLNLEPFAKRMATELSGGEAQKVMLARALVSSPKVIVFDEPTSSLDIANQLLVRDRIATISTQDVHIIVAMHDINLALGMGKSFYCLKEGRIIKQGDDSIVDDQLIMDLYGVSAHIAAHDGIKHIHFGGKET